MEKENGDSKSKMEDYEVIENIGRGAFGAASLVLHKTENKKYVLKKIRLSKHTEKFKTKACQEMNLIAKLRHPYILEYKDAWVEKGSCICVVTNYCELGNMYVLKSDIMRKARRGSHFPEEKLCKWLTQLLLAIDYLHSNRVLHRDLKVAVCLRLLHVNKRLERLYDMAGLINKINRSLISPLPIVYSSNLKQIIKSMLRKSPEHRPTAAELLRHPHLQPFLLRCQNPKSTLFLPVTSPSPNDTTKDRTGKASPCCAGGAKELRDDRERETKPKQRELLPLFDENNDTQYPNLLDGDDISIEDHLETKRVDPTSYSGKISLGSEDSKSGDNSEGNSDVSALKESKSENTDVGSEKTKDAELICGPHDTLKIEGTRVVNQEPSDKSNGQRENPRLEKADALESLLELCASLLKEDKFDELNGVLKPFSDDVVSSRETAILLTRSLMNAHKKLAKES
ncbi:serine/threonine-protein kinase nek6 [Phtheirospermum japonicum]|uniref:Serine/threonine-protein kinase nek6 n=1 Tax=Phtheirospermum japonicum TaxID=374723 RepID=A0A830BZT8_9LAMI|nr:serine/threonine-protein kinase nek6 [Phtheirospermum japonicum]